MQTNETYDVIVVGARVAGSPTAMLLARRGYRVLAVDRATFPSDTLSTHNIQNPGVQCLSRWGLLDRVLATDTDQLRGYTMDFGEFTISGWHEPASGPGFVINPRRTVLDKILVDAAVHAGVIVYEGFRVEEVLRREDGRVTGIRGRHRDGSTLRATAAIVVGADGKHSFVARSVGAEEYNELPELSAGYYAYWDNLPVSGAFEVYVRGSRNIIVVPTNDGQTLIAAQMPQADFPTFREDIAGNYAKALALAEGLQDRLASARQATKLVGAGDLRNFYRKPYGPGWALVGDAGYHRDPTLGQGISDAFRDAELLTDAIDAGLSGAEPIDQAMALYQRTRDDAVAAMYGLVTSLATMEPPPDDMAALLVAVAANQYHSDRFAGVINGTVRVEDFFSPESVAAILGQGAALEAAAA